MPPSKTLTHYDTHAREFADVHHRYHTPERTQSLVRTFFRPGDELTVDLGCGSGRDTAWLEGLDYKVIGLDASEGMLNEARARHPGIEFRTATLPEVTELRDGSADNILCSGVLMHLPEEELIPAALSLKR